MKHNQFSELRAGTALAGVAAIALFAAPAQAQNAPASAAANAQAPADQAPADTSNEIVVTGSIVRNPAAATASPVVSITSEDLSNRGISTVTDALQLLPANNAGTAAPSWSSFGFATGASAPSLRGLDDAYTLTLFNGLRTAPYPLGDDGYRNFVDINTIPTSVVETIDVLLDGASATYGSDAIAGVINVITKRQLTGLHLGASAAISSRGDNGERRVHATFGYGDLEKDGFNAYINGEYQKNDRLPLSARGAPFNTADQSSICGTAAQGCLFNGIRNGIQADGTYGGFPSTTVPFVRPYSPAITSLGGYQLLNPAAGCGNLTAYTLTATQRAVSGTSAGQSVAPAIVCQQDLVKQYRTYNSEIERKGLTFRVTKKLGSNNELYFMANYYNTKTDNPISPTGYTGATANGGIVSTVSSIYLPAYVCSAGVSALTAANQLVASGCTAANGTLNPNNPFAAQSNLARLVALPQIPRETLTDAKTYRFQGGLDGTFGNGWNYGVNAAMSRVTLDTTNRGYIYLQGLMDAVAKGTYNFVDPSQNSAAATQGVFPDNHNHSVSKLTQIQVTGNKELFEFPGGPLIVAVLGEYRYEAIHNPSANAPNNTSPNSRYYSINAVSVDGSRTVWSGGYDITAPVFKILKLKAEGSYNSYSTGSARFSPKFEAEFTPVKEVKLRGTFSKGFRIPSFSESFALPTTGFVSGSITCTLSNGQPNPTYAAFCAAHANNPSYYAGTYTYGLTSSGNLNLAPEKSTSFTAGIVLRPTPRITLTADFWRTKITNVIVPVSATSALLAEYYTNNGVVNQPGVTAIKGVADPQNLNALPLLGSLVGSYKNADAFLAKGLDFSASVNVPLGASGLKWTSKANASLLIRLEQTNDDGSISRYDGTLGACNITACSGAPKWRGNWQNTLDFNKKGSITLTAYYTSGYSEVATDSGGVYGDCQASVDNGQIVGFNDGTAVQCDAKSVFDLDGHGEVKVAGRFTLYADMLNILGKKPAYEPNAAYGLYQFNPAWSDRLFIGRFFRVGVKVDF